MKKFSQYAGIIALILLLVIIARKFYLYKLEQNKIKKNEPSTPNAEVNQRAITRALSRI